MNYSVYVEGFHECSCGEMDNCTCQLVIKVVEVESRNKLMQFLVGLGDVFEGVRNNSLSMDPLSTINKAYYMVQQVERQKEITKVVSVSVSSDNMALAPSRHHYQSYKKEFRKYKRTRYVLIARLKVI